MELSGIRSLPGDSFENVAPLLASKIDPVSLRKETEGSGLPLNPLLSETLDTYGGFDPLDYMFNQASSEPGIIGTRMKVLQELQILAENPIAKTTFDTCFTFGELHNWLITPVHDSKLSTKEHRVLTPRIVLYHRDEATRIKDKPVPEYAPDSHRVWSLPDSLVQARNATEQFSTVYGDEYPLLKEFIGQQRDIIEKKSPQELHVSAYIHTVGSTLDPTTQNMLDASADMYRRGTNTLALATFVTRLRALPIEISTERIVAVQELIHPRFDPKRQHPISIAIGETPVIITGRNGGGKTFATEAIEAAIRNGLSTGHVTAARATLQPIHLLHTVSRPESGGGGLSAFGQEVVQLGKLAATIEKLLEEQPGANALYIGDEPFSGTDPVERQELLTRYLEGLRRLGVMAIVTTHDDMSRVVNDRRAVAYKVSKRGNKHVLEAGIGDSDAFSEANQQGFDEEIIRRAEALAAGADLDLRESITQYTETVSPIEWLRAQKMLTGFAWFGNARQASPNDHRTGFEQCTSYTHPCAEEEQVPQYDTVTILGSDQVFGRYTYPQSVLHDLLLDGGTASKELLHARQDFFTRAADYVHVNKFRAELDDFRRLIFAVSKDRFRHGDQRLEAELCMPLSNISKTFVALVGAINIEVDPYHHYGDTKFTSLLESNDAYVIQLLETIQTIIDNGDNKAHTFIADFLGLIVDVQDISRPLRTRYGKSYPEDTYEERNAYRMPVDVGLRERLYAFCKKHLKNGSGSQQNFLHELNDIFYPQQYDLGDTKLKQAEATQLHYHSVSKLHELLLKNYGAPTRKLLKIIGRTKLAVDDLPTFASTIESLYRAAVTAEKAGSKAPVTRALSVLHFVASDNRPIDSIVNHLYAIGGDVANDLAGYIHQNTRQFFAGKDSGVAYGQFVQQAMQAPVKPRRYPELPIGTILPSSWDSQARMPVTPYSEALRLMGLLDVAGHMKEEGYAVWDENEKTTIHAARNVDHPDHAVNDVSYAKSGIDVLSGANMSGKTTLLRTLFANHTLAQTTGFIPSRGMSSPLYQRIIYADRPKHDTSKGLSSFGMDIEYWKIITKKLRDAAPSLVIVDEPFSTTSSYYQENLLLASLEWLAQRGHRVIIATHHHGVIEKLRQARDSPATKVDIRFRHFETKKDSDGTIHFTRKLTDGTATSGALDVARQLGGPALTRLLGP